MSKRTLLWLWIERGVVKPDRVRPALTAAGVLPGVRRWADFIENLLAWLGALALGFALLFFIAYNWAAMGSFTKFGLLESVLLLVLLVHRRLAEDNLSAKITLLLACLLLGALLAFYGQTYQTGADTWQLFANWGLLILPWVIMGRFAALWVLWLGLLNLATVLYFGIRPSIFGLIFTSTEGVFWQLFILNSLAWVGWEWLTRRFAWLAERWAIRLLALACGTAITSLCLVTIFDSYKLAPLVLVVYLAWLGAVYLVYRKHFVDLFMLAGICLSLIVVITAFFARVLLDGGDLVGGFLLLTILVTGMAALATMWLKKVHKELTA